MAKITPPGYYTTKKKKLIRQFKRTLDTIHPVLLEKYGAQAAQFQQAAMQIYVDEVIPTIPYIGGKANPWTPFMLQTALALGVQRAVQQRGGTVEEAGEIIYRGMQLMLSQMPKPFLWLYGRWVNARFQFPRLRRAAQASRKRVFPLDWVYDFVKGDGKTFDYGIDMLECGIIKYMEEQGTHELTPYLCAVDYITYHAMGVELHRTKTLDFGCDRCDFRILVGGKPKKPTWPPAFYEKGCGEEVVAQVD